jgi:DNA-binding transcriptional ArsR family regulator
MIEPAGNSLSPEAPGERHSLELRDPRALRAMAHPVRLRIMDELTQAGRATATELAEWIGESAANCSWHLRQLAQYGFIEEAGGGVGRQRPWKIAAQSSFHVRTSELDPEMSRAADAATEVLLGRELYAYRAWRESRLKAPQAWQDASFLTHSVVWLTAEELAAFKRDFDVLMERHFLTRAAADPSERRPDAQIVRLVTWAVPGGAAAAAQAPPPAGESSGR